MSLLVAVNFDDKLVLLEDGRELAITSFHDEEGDAVEDHHGAHHFRVVVPHSGEPPVFLEFDIAAIVTAEKGQLN